MNSHRALTVVFRVDASVEMGTGHVMRCLTLADALRSTGAECYFIARDHIGNLNDYIQQRGYAIYVLPSSDAKFSDPAMAELQHAHWLQASWEKDAAQSYAVIRQQRIYADWLIVDHYALDARWQRVMRPAYERLMVIDDLADREHIADLLLDQNLGRTAADYDGLIPESCLRLIGPKYALLRPEFAQWRSYSLKRRQNPELKHLLITMGGVDKDNVTGRVLDALTQIDLPSDMRISVVMGEKAPWLQSVCRRAEVMSVPTSVFIGITNMAQMMAETDFALGAAGTTTWERCTLGLPSLMFVLADNQRELALAVQKRGAAAVSNSVTQAGIVQQFKCVKDTQKMVDMANAAQRICDGAGARRIVLQLKNV